MKEKPEDPSKKHLRIEHKNLPQEKTPESSKDISPKKTERVFDDEEERAIRSSGLRITADNFERFVIEGESAEDQVIRLDAMLRNESELEEKIKILKLLIKLDPSDARKYIWMEMITAATSS
jgi:hypothetical protein